MSDELTVISILGLPYCGSTLLNLMLDSHPEIRGTGEILTLAKPELGLSSLCTQCGEDCQHFSAENRRRLSTNNFYADIADFFGASHLADSSKNMEWYRASTRFPSVRPIRFVPVLVVKHPLRQLVSFAMNIDLANRNRITPYAMFYKTLGADKLKPGTLPGPMKSLARRMLFAQILYWYMYRNSERFAQGIPQLFGAERAFVLRYEDIVLKPQETLQPLLQHVGLDYAEAMERCYDFEHHQIGGNSGALFQVTKRTADISTHQCKHDYYGTLKGIRLDNRYASFLTSGEMDSLAASKYYQHLCTVYGYAPVP